ncbi:MAG: M16 family metallopeptidase [Pyrinomonadaceae bacterium]
MKLEIKNSTFKIQPIIFAFFLLSFAFLVASAQTETPPAPSAPRPLQVPEIKSKTLANGLQVVSVERKNVPLVTVTLMIESGANAEGEKQSGLADMTASLLTKGTTTRTATQIAEQAEFLGADLNAGADWNSSQVSINVTSDKLEDAMAILYDVATNPVFEQKEIALYKKQTLDDLNVALKQPGSLASFVASRYSFGEHPAIGTPDSINQITRADILHFYRFHYSPKNAVLIFTGDISDDKAQNVADRYFKYWKNQEPIAERNKTLIIENSPRNNSQSSNVFNRILVVDLPNSGQAAVTYANKLYVGRTAPPYFPAVVANAVLGGGYSARLNEEIRIKRGLSYGAGSNLAWRASNGNFFASAQTKNVSAAQVAELMAQEIFKLTTENVADDELKPRKATLIGTFGRNLETTNGLSEQVKAIYLFGLDKNSLNNLTPRVETVSDQMIKNFAAANLKGGDIIIVGDYAKFKDDLAKRFPNQKIEVIPASQLDLNRDDLKKQTKTIVKSKSKGKKK